MEEFLQYQVNSISFALVHYCAIYILCDWEHVYVLAGCLLAMCEVCRLVLIRLLTVRPRSLNQDEII